MARIPDIPSTQDVPSGPLAWIREWFDQMRTWVQTRDPNVTKVGDPLDKFPDRRELVALGLMRRGSDGSFSAGVGAGGGTTIVIPGGGPSGGAGPTPDLTPPPTPTGLVASAGITYLYVVWDAPTYTVGHGHSRTLIYGAIWLPGDAEPTYGDARTKLIDTAEGMTTVHAYPTNPNTRWCVWIKWESIDGVASTSPAGGTHGAQATTGQDVAALLAVLTGQITESQLYSALGARIDLVDAEDTVAGSVSARVKAETDGRVAALALEAGYRVAGDAATLGSAQSYTQTWAFNKADTTGAIAAMGNSVTAAFGAADGVVYSNALAYVNFYTYAQSTIDGALASLQASLRSEFAAGDAAVSAYVASYTYAQSTLDGAFASLQASLRSEFASADGTTLVSAQNYTNSYAYALADGTALATQTSTLIARGNTRPNLCKNGGLEFGKDGLGGLLSSFAVGDGAWGRTLVSTTITTGTNAIDWPVIKAEPGAWYTIHGDALLQATSGQVYFDLVFLDAAFAVVAGGDGPQNPRNASFDFSVGDATRGVVAVQAVAPAGSVWISPRFVWASLVGCTALGVRMVKVERGELPYTPYTPEASNVGTYVAVQAEATARASETGALFAQWTVKLDVNGYVAGFGLAATGGSATPSSLFIVRADSFAIASPTGPGITAITPFIVQTVPTVVNGVAIPAGVYMDAAFIVNVTAAIARLGAAWIDDAMVANMSVSKLIAGSISVGAYAQSTGFVSGSAGWRISGNGNAEFSGVVVRGTIYASAGKLANVIISGNGIAGGAFTEFNWPASGAGGFYLGPEGLLLGNYHTGKYLQLSPDGNVFAPQFVLADGEAYFGGRLQGASGTFSGTLTADAINAVNTINIAGNAVTVPSGATNASRVVASGTSGAQVTVAQVVLDSGGAPICIQASMYWIISGSVSLTNTRVAVLVNGVEKATYTMATGSGGRWGFSRSILITSPGTGSLTVTLAASASTSGESWIEPGDGVIVVIGVKR